jgi:hypothetical protein
MRRAHVRTTAKVSAANVSAAKVPTAGVPTTGVPASATSVLRESNRSLQAGANQHTGCNQHNFSEDRTAKDKARHTGTLPAASGVEAARIARIRYTQV